MRSIPAVIEFGEEEVVCQIVIDPLAGEEAAQLADIEFEISVPSYGGSFLQK